MAFSEILPYFGANGVGSFVVAPVGGFNLIYHSLGPLRDIQYNQRALIVKDVTDAFRKTPNFTSLSKAPNPLFADKDDMAALAQAARLGLPNDNSRRLLAVLPTQKGAHAVKLIGARETATLTAFGVSPRPAKISFRYLKYTGPWPPEGPGKDSSRYSRGTARTKGEGSKYAKLVDQILRRQALITVSLESSEDVGLDQGFGPQVVNGFFKDKLRPLRDKGADVTIFVVPQIKGAEGREFPDDVSSVMVAENPKLVLTDDKGVDNFALVAAHELAHALGAKHRQTEGLLMSDFQFKQSLLLDRTTLGEINPPQAKA